MVFESNWFAIEEDGSVQRVNVHFLYNIGEKVHPIMTLSAGAFDSAPTPRLECWNKLYQAQGALDALLSQPVIEIRTCRAAAESLKALLSEMVAKLSTQDESDVLTTFDVVRLKDACQHFESILQAELSIGDFYAVSRKGAYDTTALIMYGERAFSTDLVTKAPEALFDAREATKCIAFELWTAAGYHLHRANEAVLKLYWAANTDQSLPQNPNMGLILAEMEKADPKVGSAKVRAALRDIKNLHRNPLIHPDQSIPDCNSALSLLSAINTIVSEMLKELPERKDDMARLIEAVQDRQG